MRCRWCEWVNNAHWEFLTNTSSRRVSMKFLSRLVVLWPRWPHDLILCLLTIFNECINDKVRFDGKADDNGTLPVFGVSMCSWAVFDVYVRLTNWDDNTQRAVICFSPLAMCAILVAIVKWSYAIRQERKKNTQRGEQQSQRPHRPRNAKYAVNDKFVMRWCSCGVFAIERAHSRS